MVRVGGGWDTLEHFVQKHDPCRLLVGGKFQKFDANSLTTLCALLESHSEHAHLTVAFVSCHLFRTLFS